MGALLFLFLLFGSGSNSPKCPALMDETIKTYADYAYITLPDGSRLEGKQKGGAMTFELSKKQATLFKNGWLLGTTTFGQKVTSEKPNPEAVAYNKRVQECRTQNGEF